MTDLHRRRKVVLAKVESTYGTDPTLAATDAILTRDLDIRPYQGPTVPRNNDKSHFGADPQVNTSPYVEVTFGVEIAGSGSAVDDVPGYGACLRGCGFLEAVVASTSVGYTPDVGDSANPFDSIALEFYLDGQMHQVLGCRGNVSLEIQPGEYPLYRFTFWGKYAAPTTTALITGDFSAFAQGIPVTDTNTPTVTLDAVNVVLQSLTLDLGNELAVRNIPNITENVIIADRQSSGSIVIEAPDLGTKDWFAEVRSDDGYETSVLNLVHGTVATNIVTVNCPVVQLSNMAFDEADGILTYGFDLSVMPSSGNDEISITTT